MCGGEPAWGVHEDIQIRALDPRERHLDTALPAPAPSTRHSQDLTCACTGMCLKCALDLPWILEKLHLSKLSLAPRQKNLKRKICPTCELGCAQRVIVDVL